MRILPTIILLFTVLTSKAIGLGDWQNKTPGGNVMGDSGSGTILTLKSNIQTINNITRWFFYRNYIVGQTSSDYFIANEMTGEIKRYNNLQEWNHSITQLKLSPTIWTRWFTDNWKFYERMFFVIFFIGVPVLIPIIFILFRRLNQSIKSDNLSKIKKKHLFAFTGIAIIITVRIFLDIYPQSI